MYMLPPASTKDSSLNGNNNHGSNGEDEVTSPLDRGHDSAEEGLLSQQDQARTWAKRTTKAITEQMHANPSELRGGSSPRNIFLESRASEAWAHPLTTTMSDESRGDEIELMLSPTRDSATSGT